MYYESLHWGAQVCSIYIKIIFKKAISYGNPVVALYKSKVQETTTTLKKFREMGSNMDRIPRSRAAEQNPGLAEQ